MYWIANTANPCGHLRELEGRMSHGAQVFIWLWHLQLIQVCTIQYSLQPYPCMWMSTTDKNTCEHSMHVMITAARWDNVLHVCIYFCVLVWMNIGFACMHSICSVFNFASVHSDAVWLLGDAFPFPPPPSLPGPFSGGQRRAYGAVPLSPFYFQAFQVHRILVGVWC